MQTDTDKKTAPAAPVSRETVWTSGFYSAASDVMVALDATVTDEVAVVLGDVAVPSALLKMTPEGTAFSPDADATWSYRAAQKGALTRRVERGDASPMSKPITGAVARSVIEALLGHGTILHADKSGNNLCRVRTDVVKLFPAVEGAEDCADNTAKASDGDSNAQPVWVPVPDSHKRARLYVPTGELSGPAIESSSFKRLLSLYSATDTVKSKMKTFMGIARVASGDVKVTSYITIEDALDVLMAVGVRTYSGNAACAIVLPTVDKKVIEAMPKDLREEARAAGDKALAAYREACLEAANTILGGGKPRASVKAAQAVKTGEAFKALLIKGGQERLAEGAALHGRLAALTSDLTIED